MAIDTGEVVDLKRWSVRQVLLYVRSEIAI